MLQLDVYRSSDGGIRPFDLAGVVSVEGQSIKHSIHTKIALLLASTMTVMAGAIISPALPGISRHFPDQPQVLIQLILTTPALMITLFSPWMGFLADRFGRIKLLLLALAIYGLAGFAGYLVDSVELILLSRAVLGASVAAILSISIALAGDYFRGLEQARFLGVQSAFMALGGVVFMNLGGALSDWSWRGPFLLYLTGIMLLPYAWAMLKEPRHEQMSDGERADAAVSVDYFRTGLAYLLSMISMALFYMFPAQLPFLLSQQGEISAAAIGFAVSSIALTSSIAAFSYGYIKPYFSVVSMYLLGFLVAGSGFLVVGLTESYAMVMVGAGVSGFGLGVCMPNTTVWLMRITPWRTRGRVFGGFSSSAFLGQFVSPLAVAPVAVWLASLRNVFSGAAIFCCVLAGILALLGATVLRVDRKL